MVDGRWSTGDGPSEMVHARRAVGLRTQARIVATSARVWRAYTGGAECGDIRVDRKPSIRNPLTHRDPGEPTHAHRDKLELMSDITAEQVRHLAGLARIDLSEAEIASMTLELGQIVEAVASVSSVATEDVPITSHPIPLVNVYREDVVADVLDTAQVLTQAPEHDGSRFKVSAILGEEQ